MSEENKSNGKVSKASVIEMLDTTKAGLKAYLEEAASKLSNEKQKVRPESGQAMRLAVVMFILDTCKIEGEMRKQAWNQFAATHSSFGANASASRQNVLGIEARKSVFDAMDVEP